MATSTPAEPMAGPPIRVMHILYSLGMGGMELGVLKLVTGLDRALVQSSVCSLTPAITRIGEWSGSGGLFQFERREGNDPSLIWKLYHLFRRQKPDVVHTHAWGTLCEGVAAARLARVPFVVHGEHGTMEERPRNVRIQRQVWRRVNKVLAVSEKLAERMASVVGFPVERISVIRNGVDLARFGSGHRDATRRQLRIPNDAFVVGTVGRLVPIKDQHGLLTAVAILRQQGLKVTVVLVGDGPLKQDLQNAATSMELRDDVHFLGARDDVPDLMAAMDVFALTSRSEGMSNTVLEAMACGLPVVATRVGGNVELVQDGATGILVPAETPESVARALAGLHGDTDRRRRLGQNGRLRANTEFSLDGMLRRYEGVYMDVVRRRGSHSRGATSAVGPDTGRLSLGRHR